MPYKVTIIDYKIGNLFSVYNALKIVGIDPIVSGDPKIVAQSDCLILPGVGAFSAGIKNLKSLGLDRAIYEFVKKDRPLLGLCLGMQLLMNISYEFGSNTGLSLINGSVDLISGFDSACKPLTVPNIGWHKIIYDADCPDRLLPANESDDLDYFYFVHSYAVHADHPENCYAHIDLYGS